MVVVVRLLSAGLVLSVLSTSLSVFAKTEAKPSESPAPERPNAETREIMHSIFAPLSELLPISMDFKKFSDPAQKKTIDALVGALVDRASVLEKHSQTKNPGFKFLSHSLVRDVKEIKTWYEMGRYDEARFIIHNLTEYCISCHTEQTGSANFTGSSGLFSKVEIKSLPLIERAQLLVATRQFDQALTTYEEFFKSTDYSPAQMALMQAFPDYLKVAIRVRGDLQRPIPVLEQWAKRPGVPSYMQTHIREWIASLRAVDKKGLLKNPTLANAKALMRLGQADVTSARSREKLVYFISASALLNQLVNDRKTSAADFAESYYLMGICESVIGRSFWVSQTEFYLESAIRGAPHTEIARKAFQELEEQIFAEFSGSSGTNIPEDVSKLLEELRALSYSEKKQHTQKSKN